MLENYNRVNGIGYGVASPQSITPVRPNPLYSGFNYRSNSVSSNYNSLIAEATKRMGHGLQFDTSYTFSKLLDVNSELFAGCSAVGGFTAPYYYIDNANPRLNYGRGAEDHRHAYKFNVTYDLPFLKAEKGFVGHALGGWSLGSFFQLYSGHPVDVYVGALGTGASTRFRARDASGAFVLDQNGVPFNLGGDYNLDSVLNDHPIFLGSSLTGDGNQMARVAQRGFAHCWASGSNLGPRLQGIWRPVARDRPADAAANGFEKRFELPATVANIGTCNAQFAGGSPSTLFGNPAYPGSGPGYLRFGTLGRDVFHGPRFIDLDFGLHKTFKVTESMNLRFSADAENLANHPNFDGIQGNLVRKQFGQAQLLVGSARSRIMSLSLRLAF